MFQVSYVKEFFDSVKTTECEEHKKVALRKLKKSLDATASDLASKETEDEIEQGPAKKRKNAAGEGVSQPQTAAAGASSAAVAACADGAAAPAEGAAASSQAGSDEDAAAVAA
eukprot:1619295-Pyramimonas_sp.AAC.1